MSCTSKCQFLIMKDPHIEYWELLTIGPSQCLELSLPKSSFPDVDSATGLYVAEHTATTPDPDVQQQLQWKFLYIKTVEETVTCLLVVICTSP